MSADPTQLFDEVLARGARRVDGPERAPIDALCRQIDVRKKLDADPAVVAELIGVLLANAAEVGTVPADGGCNDGWGLKCTNSALKALDLRDDVPGASQLRVQALSVLDRVLSPEEPV